MKITDQWQFLPSSFDILVIFRKQWLKEKNNNYFYFYFSILTNFNIFFSFLDFIFLCEEKWMNYTIILQNCCKCGEFIICSPLES